MHMNSVLTHMYFITTKPLIFLGLGDTFLSNHCLSQIVSTNRLINK